MLSYCYHSKSTESKKPKVVKTNDGRIMVTSKYAICGSKKSRFIKQQEPSKLLSSLEIKTPLSQIPVVGPVLF